MAEPLEITLTPEEKLLQAQGSLNAHVLATILYLKEHGRSADTIWRSYGPIAGHLGLGYQCRRAGDEVTLTFTRRH
jgi:hypothetical protein